MELDVNYISKLARLKLTEEEKIKFSKQLTKILEFMNTLNEIDTKDIKPTSHVIELNNVFREDVVKPSELADDILANAPEREGLYFKVKKVIE